MNIVSKTILLTVSTMIFSLGLSAAQVDLKESKFSWKVDKKLGAGHDGDIFLKSAKADLVGNKIKSGEFVMDVQTFTVNELSGEWKKKFLSHVKSGDFFQADKFNTATLVVKKQLSDTKLSAELTIKDITHPVTVEFKRSGKTYSGKLVIDRTKWGIKYGSETFFSALKVDKIIKNEIEIDFKVVLK